VRFLVLGDWGGLPVYPYVTPVETSVAKRMALLAETMNAQFVLALGDNFYFDGVKNVDDKRFKVCMFKQF
jgi:tartrate-resistant acid phosphatase type 5